MKIFHRDEKVNFVDDNNVFVGYDLRQKCCELADWYFAEKEYPKGYGHRDVVEDLESYNFDTNYFKDVSDIADVKDGGMVIFKLSNGAKDLFLHIFNSHNGFYWHGFKAEINSIKWQEGYL